MPVKEAPPGEILRREYPSADEESQAADGHHIRKLLLLTLAQDSEASGIGATRFDTHGVFVGGSEAFPGSSRSAGWKCYHV